MVLPKRTFTHGQSIDLTGSVNDNINISAKCYFEMHKLLIEMVFFQQLANSIAESNIQI